MASNASISLNDYNGQTSVMSFNIAEVTSANIVATAAAMGTLRAALSDVSLGIVVQSSMAIRALFAASDAKSGSDLAERGNKWLLTYRDTSQYLDAPTNSVANPNYLKLGSLEVPCATLALRDANSDVIYLEASGGLTTEIDDFVAAVEALVKSPTLGTIVVTEMRAVTRNIG